MQKEFPLVDTIVIDGEKHLVMEAEVFKDFFKEVSSHSNVDPELASYVIKQFNKYNKIKRKRIRNKKVKQCMTIMYNILDDHIKRNKK